MLIEEKTPTELTRIDNNSFLFETAERPVIIRLPKVTSDGRLARQVAEAAYEILQQDEPDLAAHFPVRNRSWKIFPKEQTETYFWSLVNLVQALYQDTQTNTYEVYETGYLGWWTDSCTDETTEISIPLSESFVIRASADDIALHEPYDNQPFADPFTKLATVAFQKYETAYCHPDYFSFNQAQTRIVFHEDQFSLVKNTSPLAQDKELNQKTLELYESYINETYGRKKIEEITERYQIVFDDSVGLTPEHIYRINIGVHDICIDDVKNLWSSLFKVMGAHQTKNLTVPLEDFLEAISCDLLPGRVKRALYRMLKKSWTEPKKGDFTLWFSNLTKMASITDVKQVSPKAFNELMLLLIPDNDSCERSLTGRKNRHVLSYLTNAETKEFKPWVDQQDYFQTIILLRGNSNTDLFYEKLSYVIAKKHLARRLLDGNYRVGGLIPAPSSFGWYEVTSCISTPTGFHSYTLESTLPHILLDKIKLYRSTASDPCALRSSESVLNDLNCINSPGYEGRGIAEPYEYPFFKESTIPVWVGYVLLAKKELGREGGISDAFQHLLSANETFLQFLTQDFQRKTFRQIIREHDAVLNNLFRRKRRSFGSYADITRFIRKSVVDKAIGEFSSQNDEKIASKLFTQLEKFSEIEEDPAQKFAIVRLKDEIYRHVLQYYEISFLKEEKRSRRFYSDILKFKEVYEPITNEEDQVAILSQWISRFEFIAEELEENLEAKQPQNIVLAGHSLGGACAMSHIVWYFCQKVGGRIPCPDHYCAGYVHCDPGTNDSDNEIFKTWGYSHRILMRKLKCGFHIKRIHEGGDIVATGGEVHLGATYCKKEDLRLKTWLQYEFSIRQLVEEPKNLISTVAHGTQFEDGKLGDDYEETEVTSDQLGEFDHRGSIKTVYNRCSDEFNRVRCDEDEQKWAWDVRRLQWKLGGAVHYVDSDWVRSHYYLTWLASKFFGFDNNERISNLTDVHGVFVVTSDGVITKSEDSDEGEADVV